MQHRPYGLLLFEHDAGDDEAVRPVKDLLHDGRPVPFILLSEDADEKVVADIIGGGTWNCLAKSRLDGAIAGAHDSQYCRAAQPPTGTTERGRILEEAIASRRTVGGHGRDHRLPSNTSTLRSKP